MNRKRLTKLIDICQHKWIIPLISLLEQKDLCGFNTMAKELKLSKDSLNSTLKYMISTEIISKRKDISSNQIVYYYLTDQSKRISGNCLHFYEQSTRLKSNKIIGYKWTLPIIAALIEKKYKFSELKTVFPGITSRALSKTLKYLIYKKVIKKEILSTQPLIIMYSLTQKGESLYKALNNFYLMLS